VNVPGKDAGPEQLRVLVRGATTRDDSMTARALESASILACPCPSVETLLVELRVGAGALLLAEEALAERGARTLFQELEQQAPWSDLPVLILARQGADSPAISDALSVGANVTVLERPIRIAALISAVRSALRGRRRQYQLRELLRGLRDTDQRKTDFLATLAHELRNPLAPIRAGVGILQRSPANPGPVLEVMERQLHHIVRLVDDLLELSRINRGMVELRPERVTLETIVAAARETSQPRIDAGRHTLEVTLPEQTLWLDADPVRVAQVLSNLLNNAARYTDNGGHIVLEAHAEDGEAVVSVTDNGVGIGADMLPMVFDMFSQADSRDARAQHGLGIGLALVRNLVEMHAGSVSAHSDGPGTGSRFEIRLPLASAPD